MNHAESFLIIQNIPQGMAHLHQIIAVIEILLLEYFDTRYTTGIYRNIKRNNEANGISTQRTASLHHNPESA